jgi:hypothetical protein
MYISRGGSTSSGTGSCSGGSCSTCSGCH